MTDAQKWLAFALLAGGAILIYLLRPILFPFLCGALFAYLGNPLVERLVSWRWSRTLAVTAVFAGFLFLALLILFFLAPMMQHQMMAFIIKLPAYIDWVQETALPWLQRYLPLQQAGFDLSSIKQAIEQHWQQMGDLAAGAVAVITRSGLILMGWIANLVLIPLVTFYLLRDWPVLLHRIGELIPRQAAPVVFRLAQECDAVLGGFLRGQLSVMLALGTVYSVGLWMAGLDMALLIGAVAGLVSFVPYLGFITGVLLAGIAVVVQYHDVMHLLPVLAVFGVGQVLESFVLTPILIGDRVGLHPLAVIFAVMAGGQLFGFTGVLLALPVAAVIMVLLRYAHERYMGSRVYDGGVE